MGTICAYANDEKATEAVPAAQNIIEQNPMELPENQVLVYYIFLGRK